MTDKSKRQLYWQEYFAKNKEKIREAKRVYESDPEVKARKKERSAELYQKHKEKVKHRCFLRQKERKEFIEDVALKYGCQNKDCKWKGTINCSYLDFHHLDPNLKLTELSKMKSWSWKKIITEINKCVVLCKNCHALVHMEKISIDESMLCEVKNIGR